MSTLTESQAPAQDPAVRTGPTPGQGLTSAEVAAWLERMATGGDLGPLRASTPAELCDLLRDLELMKNAVSAAQARVTVLAEAGLHEAALAAGTPKETADKGISQQLALARRESPHAGSRHVGFAKALVGEMPQVHAALTAGLIGEWTATQIVKETACLSVEDRAAVDSHLAGRLGSESHRQLVAAAKAKAYELDPYSVVRRGRKARSDRRVSVRPAPDVMAIVSGYVPVAQGVACYKALDEAAKAAKAAGDERSMDQLRADIFTERLTGQSQADDVSIEVGLVMTDKSLLGLDETPARLEGYGPIPAPLARDLIRDRGEGCAEASSGHGAADGKDKEGAAGETGVTSETGVSAGSVGAPGAPDDGSELQALARKAVVWLRRMYADPATGELTGQDERRRLFSGPLRRFVVARDQVCRTPWCDAPVRHADHVLAWARGGRTTAREGQGLCEACNYAKEANGWSHEVVVLADGTQAVKITTPTGHTYYSVAPPVLPTLGDERSSLRAQGRALPGEGGQAHRGEAAQLDARGETAHLDARDEAAHLDARDHTWRGEKTAAEENLAADPGVGRATAMARDRSEEITVRLRPEENSGEAARSDALEDPTALTPPAGRQLWGPSLGASPLEAHGELLLASAA